jgi:hypothetical protein
MYVIKRTKSPPPGPMDALVGAAAPAVHWATSISRHGDVDGWTPDREKAALLNDDEAGLVLARYARRGPPAGRVEAVQVTTPEPEPEPMPAPMPAPEPTTRKFRGKKGEQDAGAVPVPAQAEA